jgi:hypothetical protein
LHVTQAGGHHASAATSRRQAAVTQGGGHHVSQRLSRGQVSADQAAAVELRYSKSLD